MDRKEYLRGHSNMKCQRVQVDESYVPVLKDDEMEDEHLLEEHRNGHISMDAGSLDSHTTLNGMDDLGLEVLDGILDDVEINDLDGIDVFSGACDEYFLDCDFVNDPEVLGYGLSKGSLLQNSSSESHSSGFSGSSIVGGVSESTKVPSAQPECKNYSPDGTTTSESSDALRNNPSQPSNGDCMYIISLDMKHLHELNNDHPLAGGILSFENEKDAAEEPQPTALREKRFRKPTKRYIEESSNLRSKEKVPTAATKNSDVTLSALKVCRGHPKKKKLENDKEPLSSESEDEPKRKDRRKSQKMWTLPEVKKLVDGISEYGIGRWTNIKRFFFSSSSYRTPTDIRDKWRNLLRASSAQKSYDKEAEQNDELALRPLPLDVVHRVRELAKIHPYPRARGSKKSCVRSSLGKRNFQRKRCS
ncbi:PREDICTED: uncharacterized protein LOC109360393 isoform X4 [Lupinus angustifolius]|uniref:uncharacterized protein LOC109360393 isoform X4 n=1 Tax=Lupinus angustifolius TaxID=3871 RepID=UPI00092E95F6|nr:PREDICTED: uncharacterized protein LOC109360393 isoform X4 [Lupinus angustifolius]